MIAFIILHYKTMEDTIRCVKSIQETSVGHDYKIVVVDNGSGNGTGELLQKKYENSSDVVVLQCEKNLGFSAGNNVGCRFARETYAPDFLYVLNNDTYIEDVQTISKIEQYYEKTAFDILGPCIWDTVKEVNSNPWRAVANYEEALEAYNNAKRSEKLLKINQYLFYIVGRFTKTKQSGFSLHGAGLIFSKKYCERFEQVFAEQTFIYYEESMLTYRTIKYDLTMKYCEDIKLFHNHSKSTQADHKSRKKLWLFQNKYMLEACKRLVEIYQNNLDI